MRLRFGPVPDDPGFAPEDGGWVRLKEPSFGRMLLMALPLSVLLAMGISLAWGTVARVRDIGGGVGGSVTPGGVLWLLVAFAALLLVHELLHAAALPSAGLSTATTLGFWPKALTPYVSYEGALTRDRNILVCATPFLALSVVPIVVGLLLAVAPPWVVALGMVNAFGSSADLIGACLLAFRVPSSALVRNKGRETWWRDPGPRQQGSQDS
jgi:hypothetical protein